MKRLFKMRASRWLVIKQSNGCQRTLTLRKGAVWNFLQRWLIQFSFQQTQLLGYGKPTVCRHMFRKTQLGSFLMSVMDGHLALLNFKPWKRSWWAMLIVIYAGPSQDVVFCSLSPLMIKVHRQRTTQWQYLRLIMQNHWMVLRRSNYALKTELPQHPVSNWAHK